MFSLFSLIIAIPIRPNPSFYFFPIFRKPGEDSDAESSRETSSCASSDCEPERKAKGHIDGICNQESSVKLDSQKMNRLSLRDKKPPMSSSGDETEVCNSLGELVFEYLEQEQPHHRKPLYDQASGCQFVHLNHIEMGSSLIII